MYHLFLILSRKSQTLIALAVGSPFGGPPWMLHRNGRPLTRSGDGHDAFGAIQEIVQILDADPNTDWSKVDLEALRQHLIDGVAKNTEDLLNQFDGKTIERFDGSPHRLKLKGEELLMMREEDILGILG